jgi:hypothetical protein
LLSFSGWAIHVAVTEVGFACRGWTLSKIGKLMNSESDVTQVHCRLQEPSGRQAATVTPGICAHAAHGMRRGFWRSTCRLPSGSVYTMGRATMYMVHATPVIACNMYQWGPGVVGYRALSGHTDHHATPVIRHNINAL